MPHDGARVPTRAGTTAARPVPTGGRGRVRAQLVGGDLDHGATPDGGWAVHLTLPVEHPTRDPIITMRAPAALPEAPA